MSKQTIAAGPVALKVRKFVKIATRPVLVAAPHVHRPFMVAPLSTIMSRGTRRPSQCIALTPEEILALRTAALVAGVKL